MQRKSFACMLAGILCLGGLSLPARAVDVDCDTAYCFARQDFAEEENLQGVCITDLAGGDAGSVMLGTRVIRPGDILSADQLARMTFCPLRSETDREAELRYLPVFEDHVAPGAVMTISVRGKKDQAPVAEDSAVETYKNLPNEAMLKVNDPEGEKMTFTLIRLPKRGEAVIREDGSFIYTPKKNKVGVDSFTYTAADPAGNVSREATVTVTIMKPGDSGQYTDLTGDESSFAAEWMKNTGIFVAERMGGNGCFQPEKQVSRGDFLTMLVEALDIPLDEQASVTGYEEEVPQWLKPYLAAAMRSGLTAGWPEGNQFQPDAPITGAEAAVMLQNALDLEVPDAEPAQDTAGEHNDVPVWAADALNALQANGIAVAADEILTRSQAAVMLYHASCLALEAPGMAVFQALQ